MRSDLKRLFGSGTSYFADELQKSCASNVEYAIASGVGHAAEMHTYKNSNDFLQKTALRICNEKENHADVSVLANKQLLYPILKETMTSHYVSEISKWMQYSNTQKHIVQDDFGYDTGFVVDKNMSVHQTSGITLVFQRATDPITKESCPFGFYLSTAYPSSNKKFYTNTLGTLNRYGVLDVLRKQLPTRLEQAAFLHSGDHNDVKVEIVENIAHEKRIRLIYQEYKNDEMYRHVVNIKPNGQEIYHCKKLEENPAYTKNLKVDCPVLYKIALSIHKDLQMEDREFEHRITEGKQKNDQLLSRLEIAEQEILQTYIEDELLENQPVQKKEIVQHEVEDRFSITDSAANKAQEGCTLTNLDDEIRSDVIHQEQQQDIINILQNEQESTR